MAENNPWPKGTKKRLAAINAFAFSGTNAHAIIEEAPAVKEAPKIEERPLHIVTLSARTKDALKDQIHEQVLFIQEHPSTSIGDYAFTLNAGRNHFKHRVAVVADSMQQLQKKLQEGDYHAGVVTEKNHQKVSFAYEKEGTHRIDKSDALHHKVYLSPNTQWSNLLKALAEYYTKGAQIDWLDFDSTYQRRKLILPSYPFQHASYWVQPVESKVMEKPKVKASAIPTELASLLEVHWEEQALQPAGRQLPGTWLVVNPSPPFSNALLKAIEHPITAENGKVFVDEPVDGVILFSPEDSPQNASKSLLQLIPYFSEIHQLVVVTQGQLNAAPLAGFVRVIAQEFPDIKCKYIETDDPDIVEEILQQDHEVCIKHTQGKRYVQRLKPVENVFSTPNIKPESTYLITGGLGSLGRLCAEQLIQQGAKDLILVGRKEADEASTQWIRQLSAQGIRILYKRADIADEGETLKLLFSIKSSIKGIIHAAGVIDDAILRNQSWDKFEPVFAPKVAGAWNLHFLTRELGIALDFLVFFSSYTSLLGTPGQANYAAANAYLDALARERRANGLAATSVNWAGWKEGGMALQGRALENLESQFPGIGLLSNAQGLHALSQVLGSSLTGVLVAPNTYK